MFDSSPQSELDAIAPDELRALSKKLVFAVLLSVRRTGLNMTRSLVWLALAHDERGWSVSALADACDLDRKSVRETLRHFSREGLVEFERDGWRFTGEGLRRRVEIFDKFWEEAPPLLRSLVTNSATNIRGGKSAHSTSISAQAL